REPSGPALARETAARPAARAPPRRGGARQAGRDDRLQRVHAQCRRERSRCRRVGPRARSDACRRVAAVPPSEAARVPAPAPARARDERLLRREAPRSVTQKRVALGAARIVGAGVLALLALIPAFVYSYAISISAGLCGDHGPTWILALAVGIPLVVVGSWGVMHGNWIFVAWPAAVLAAAACLMLVSYLRPGARGYCETITPYERSVFVPARYSVTSSQIASSPRVNVTSNGPFSSTRQPGSTRL